MSLSSVRNRSGIIAHEGLPNAKPLIVDFILPVTRDKLSIKNQCRPEVKSSLNEITKVYLTIVTYFMCDLLFEIGCFIKF